MIATLLTAVLLTVASGLVTYYVPALEEALGEVHEVFATLTLVLVIVHVIGVSVSSYLQKENLIGGMISGWKRETGERTTKMNTRMATERNHNGARHMTPRNSGTARWFVQFLAPPSRPSRPCFALLVGLHDVAHIVDCESVSCPQSS